MAKIHSPIIQRMWRLPCQQSDIVLDGHDSHFGDGALRKMMCKNIQPFVLKSGNYINSQPIDNVPNAKLKSIYNVVKSMCMLKCGTKRFSPHHMNSILVEAWDSFKISSGNIIRDSFAKTKLPPSALPT